MKLHELNAEYKDLLFQAQTFDEETPTSVVDEWLAKFEEFKGERNKKLESVFFLMREADGEAQFIANEIERLTQRMNRKQKQSERFKSMIEFSMKNAKEEKVETQLFTAQFKKNPAKLDLIDAVALDGLDKELEKKTAEMESVKSKISARKKEIKTALKNGEVVNGARLVQNKRLEIK